MSSNFVIVIGGGAAGLLASMGAAESGASVTVLEKMDRPGRKLAITGKGRCNLTTGRDIEEAISEFGKNGRWLRSAFSRFYREELVSLFESLGIPVTTERGQRVFPLSMRAPDVVKAILRRLDELNVKIIRDCRVRSIIESGGSVAGVESTAGLFDSGKVILATGGASYPVTGSTGDGYALAARLGHSIVRPLPALVPIELKGAIHRKLSPLTLKNAFATLELDGGKISEEFGEITFTSYGVAGPAILPLGKYAAENAGKGVLSLIVNIKPALGEAKLEARIQRDLRGAGNAPAETILPALLPLKAVPVFSQLWGLPPERTANQVTREERRTLCGALSSLRFEVRGTRPIAEAIVTAGGVSIHEVNPKTMESKIVKGLYICGELLDLDAGTGGYNLQAAFSTGWAAGNSAAED